MTTTPDTRSIDLTKPTNVGESTCQLLIVPHVPSFNAMRQIVCETSTVLVNQTNLIRVVKNRCTTHLNLSVDHLVVEHKMLELVMNLFSSLKEPIACMRARIAWHVPVGECMQ